MLRSIAELFCSQNCSQAGLNKARCLENRSHTRVRLIDEVSFLYPVTQENVRSTP